MFYAILIITPLLAGFPALELEDTAGPYPTIDGCKERLAEMQDTLPLALAMHGFPPGMPARVEGYCIPGDEAETEA